MAKLNKDFGTKVYVDGPQDFNKAMRRWIKRVDSCGIIQEVRERQYFVKASTLKRLKRKKCQIVNRRQYG
jgi:ribosomal protein S21